MHWAVTEIPDLEPLFLPRSVAVYGASTRDPSRLGNRLLRNAMASALDDVQAISPTPGTAQGLRTTPSLAGQVDLTLISVPAASVEAAMADAAAGGARAAIVLTSGFGETGEQGQAAQDRLRAIATRADMRFLGPNCMGVISRLNDGGWMNGSYFWDVDLAPGGVTMLSQSGAFGGMFLAEMSRRGLGVCRFASLGNAADLDETQILRWLAQDDETQVIGLFAEALSGGHDFVTTVRSLSAERPVVVLKAGKTATGARAAISHTGSIAGTHGAVSAALRRAGAMEARTTDEFFDLLALAASPMRPPAGSRLAVLTVSGGPSVLAADEAERLGLVLPQLADSTLEVLLAVVPSFAATRNPVDLTPQCPPEAYGPAVDAVYNDRNTITVLAPPEAGEVESVLKALRGWPLLAGDRGSESVDLHALEAIVRIVVGALTEHSDILEIDCNPVVITTGKPTVVDALVVVCSAPSESPNEPAQRIGGRP